MLVVKEYTKKLSSNNAQKKRYKALNKALDLLKANPAHAGLHTHKWQGNSCPHGKTLWECYAENNTPGAFRVFFCYCKVSDDSRALINIIAVGPHP